MEKLTQDALALLHEAGLCRPQPVFVALEDRESADSLIARKFLTPEYTLTESGSELADALSKKLEELSVGVKFELLTTPTPEDIISDMHRWGESWFTGTYKGVPYVTNQVVMLSGRPKSAKIRGAKEGSSAERYRASMFIKSVLEPNRRVYAATPVLLTLMDYRYPKVLWMEYNGGERLPVQERFYRFLVNRFKRSRVYVLQLDSGMRLLIGKVTNQGFSDIVWAMAPIRQPGGEK